VIQFGPSRIILASSPFLSYESSMNRVGCFLDLLQSLQGVVL